MAISQPQDNFKVTLGGESRDVTYTKYVYGTINDVVSEANESDEKAEYIRKLVNDAKDAELKLAARTKFLGSDANSTLKAIDDQVKSYINQRKKAGKPYDEEAIRERFTAMAME